MWTTHQSDVNIEGDFVDEGYCLGWISTKENNKLPPDPSIQEMRWHGGDWRGSYAFTVRRWDGLCYSLAWGRDRKLQPMGQDAILSLLTTILAEM